MSININRADSAPQRETHNQELSSASPYTYDPTNPRGDGYYLHQWAKTSDQLAPWLQDDPAHIESEADDLDALVLSPDLNDLP